MKEIFAIGTEISLNQERIIVIILEKVCKRFRSNKKSYQLYWLKEERRESQIVQNLET